MLNSEETFNKIKQNRPIQECLNTIPKDCLFDAIWFLYYMFFAIHNPKMEEYIQKKLAKSTSNNIEQDTSALRDIMKNMIKRRHHTSEIVFRLYTYAYTNNANVTHIYPKYKDDISKQLIKSYQSNHLKTTAVLLRRSTTATVRTDAPINDFIEYIITTAPTIASASSPTAVLNKINHHISYTRKDIIILALSCYMKIDEDDINKKNIFIAATEEDAATTSPPTATATDATEPERPFDYDEKYKYLYT
jgi:hypothetical protein